VNEPLLKNRLISAKADVTGVNVTVHLPNKNTDVEIPEVVGKARELAKKMEVKYPNIKIYLTGIVMMNNAFPEASNKDMATLIPMLFLIVILFLWALLRSISAVLATVVVFICSIVSAMGVAGWLGITLSPASASAPIIILTLAVADSVHLISYFFQQLRKPDTTKLNALLDSLKVNFLPIFLTSITTVFGFLSMNFSDSPPFRDLGNVTAVGVGLAFIFSITMLPALLMLLPVKAPQRGITVNNAIMGNLANFVTKNKSRLLWSITAVFMVLLVCGSQNELDDNFVKYFDKSIPVRVSTDFTNDHLTGVSLFEYNFNTAVEGGVSDPTFMKKIDQFVTWYRQQPEVQNVASVTDIVKRLNKNMHADDEKWYRIPSDHKLIAQYLLLYEMSLPFGLDLNNQINLDKSATRVTVTLHTISNKKMLALEERAQAWLRINEVQSMHPHGVGWAIMFAHISMKNIKSMLTGTTLALVLISLFLIFALRSFKYGVLSLIPNLMPAAITFGIWGLAVGRIGLAASIVTAVTLGIIVDDTIHFMSKYMRARRQLAMNSVDAVRYAFENVGLAIITTSIVLFAGFIVLSFSTFAVNSTLGLLVAITIVVALLLDILLLPSLLLTVDKAVKTTEEIPAGVSLATASEDNR
jgi:predicted RND superfamily exporter protein